MGGKGSGRRSKITGIRLPYEMREKIAGLAESNGDNFSQQAIRLLRLGLLVQEHHAAP